MPYKFKHKTPPTILQSIAHKAMLEHDLLRDLIALNILFFFVELNGGDPFIEKWAFIPNRFVANSASDFLTIFTGFAAGFVLTFIFRGNTTRRLTG